MSRQRHLKMWVIVVFTVLTSSLFAVQRSGEELVISHRARALQPGEVVLVSVQSKTPLLELSAEAFGKRFLLNSEADSSGWIGLIGIDLDTKPGDHAITFEGKTADGNIRQIYRITVEPKEFPVRHLTVEPKYVSPPEDQLERIQQESRLVSRIFATVTEERLWAGEFVRPVPGSANSSFGKRSVFNGKPRSPHTGTDFRGAKGTPVKAPGAGRVVLVKDLYFAGNTVIIDHGQGLISYFAHLSEFETEDGQQVEKGQVIGKVGATGRVTGPHLHWTLRLNETRVSPLSLLEVLSRE